MSWNASFNTKEEFRNDKPTFASPSLAEIQANDGTRNQYLLARQAAELLLSRPGVIPAGKSKEDGSEPDDTDGDVQFSVNLSGHANPNHRPAEGWANDCVSVSVTQR